MTAGRSSHSGTLAERTPAHATVRPDAVAVHGGGLRHREPARRPVRLPDPLVTDARPDAVAPSGTAPPPPTGGTAVGPVTAGEEDTAEGGRGAGPVTSGPAGRTKGAAGGRTGVPNRPTRRAEGSATAMSCSRPSAVHAWTGGFLRRETSELRPSGA